MDLRAKEIESARDAKGQEIRVGTRIHPHRNGETLDLTTYEVRQIVAVYDYDDGRKYLGVSVWCKGAALPPSECVVRVD